MDDALLKLVNTPTGDKSTKIKIQYGDVHSGTVDVNVGGVTHRVVIKPLAELYGPGDPSATADPLNERYTPLFLRIEETLLHCAKEDRTLTDASVSLALSVLSMSPDANPGDELAYMIQFDLRLLLSINNYSRAEVRQALRKINKSVDRHTRRDGPHGYLLFIRRSLPQ